MPNTSQVLGTLQSRSEHTNYIDFAVTVLVPGQLTGLSGEEHGSKGPDGRGK